MSAESGGPRLGGGRRGDSEWLWRRRREAANSGLGPLDVDAPRPSWSRATHLYQTGSDQIF